MKTYTINVITTFTLDIEVPADSADEALKAAKKRYENKDHYGNILDVDFQVYSVQDENGKLLEE